MSKLGDLKSHIHSIEEIKSILGAMKNLSLVELNKVERYTKNQLEINKVYFDALVDYRQFFSEKENRPETTGTLFVLIGSERGFCGGFNEKVIEHFHLYKKNEALSKLLVVGRKLDLKIQNEIEERESIEGPNVVEEIPHTISRLGDALIKYAHYKWLFIFNEGMQSELKTRGEYPLEFKMEGSFSGQKNPSLLYLNPQEFHSKLLENYLTAALYRILYLSFLAENKERLRHMDAAVEKIEDNIKKLKVKKNTLRQEEITQELEIILLSTGKEL